MHSASTETEMAHGSQSSKMKGQLEPAAQYGKGHEFTEKVARYCGSGPA